MKEKGFTLIEMMLYVALFSFLGITLTLLYTQVQNFFTYGEMYMDRFVVRRYVALVTESELDFVDPNCLKAGLNISCSEKVLLDESMFQRLLHIGSVQSVTFDINEDILTVLYTIKIGNKVFSEQVQIYLI